ncbi:hypothetical protein BDZ94DRAFT_1371119 [Collybia nuda]|uniref:Uncharacterized protein n=1 Tax=Collybia nuda TaxID=64659 RepID=A0A9P6CI66_9AGAR|nr:hypothetical protein BDZ94DRAFT_1371119 [Collybia nuda]
MSEKMKRQIRARKTVQTHPDAQVANEADASANAVENAIQQNDTSEAADTCFLGYGTICLAHRTDVGRGPILEIKKWNIRDAVTNQLEDFKHSLGEGYSGLQALSPENAVFIGVRRGVLDVEELGKVWSKSVKPLKWIKGVQGKTGLALLINGNHRRSVMESIHQKSLEVLDRLETTLGDMERKGDIRSEQYQRAHKARNSSRDTLQRVGRWTVKVYDLALFADAIESHILHIKIRIYLSRNILYMFIAGMSTAEEAITFVKSNSDNTPTSRAGRASSNGTMLCERKPFSAKLLFDSRTTVSPFLKALCREGYLQFLFLCTDLDVPHLDDVTADEFEDVRNELHEQACNEFTGHRVDFLAIPTEFVTLLENAFQTHLAEAVLNFGSPLDDHIQTWEDNYEVYVRDVVHEAGAWVEQACTTTFKDAPEMIELLQNLQVKLEWILDGRLFDCASVGMYDEKYRKPLIVPEMILSIVRGVHAVRAGYDWMFTLVEPLSSSTRGASTILASHFKTRWSYNLTLSSFYSARLAIAGPVHQALTVPKTKQWSNTKGPEVKSGIYISLTKLLGFVMVSEDSSFPPRTELEAAHVRTLEKCESGEEILAMACATMTYLFHATFKSNAQGKLSVKSGCKTRARNNLYRTYQLVQVIWGENLKKSSLYPVIYRYYTTQVKPLLEETNHKGWYTMAQPSGGYPLDLMEFDAVEICASNLTSDSNLTQTTKILRGIARALILDTSAAVPHRENGKDIARHNLTMKAVINASFEGVVIDPETLISNQAVTDFLLEMDIPRLPDKASDEDMEALFANKSLDPLQDIRPAPEVLAYHKRKQGLLTSASFHRRKEQAVIERANQPQYTIKVRGNASTVKGSISSLGPCETISPSSIPDTTSSEGFDDPFASSDDEGGMDSVSPMDILQDTGDDSDVPTVVSTDDSIGFDELEHLPVAGPSRSLGPTPRLRGWGSIKAAHKRKQTGDDTLKDLSPKAKRPRFVGATRPRPTMVLKRMVLSKNRK